MEHNELAVLVLPTSFIVSTPFNKYKIQTSSKIHKILLNLKQEQPEQQSDEITGDEGEAGVCFDRETEQRASLRVTGAAASTRRLIFTLPRHP